MSVKAMSLVWDMECPGKIEGKDFKPGHKYVLLAYADHADHNGFSIYPAVMTIAKKTGYDERSVQRLTRELEELRVLIPDGDGPRGTKRWFIPFNNGGDKISPLTKYQGDKSFKSLGDIPSGDIPSGDKMSPELKELNLNNIYIDNNQTSFWGGVKEKLRQVLPKAKYETWVVDTEPLGYIDKTLVIAVRNSYGRDWLLKNVKQKAQELSGKYVEFYVADPAVIDNSV